MVSQTEILVLALALTFLIIPMLWLTYISLRDPVHSDLAEVDQTDTEIEEE